MENETFFYDPDKPFPSLPNVKDIFKQVMKEYGTKGFNNNQLLAIALGKYRHLTGKT